MTVSSKSSTFSKVDNGHPHFCMNLGQNIGLNCAKYANILARLSQKVISAGGPGIAGNQAHSRPALTRVMMG